MTRRKYTDRYDDPLFDREDEKYGDFDDEDLDGFSIVSLFDNPEETDDDDNA